MYFGFVRLTFFTDDRCEHAKMGSISVSRQLPTYPSPKPTLTLTCCQLTVVVSPDILGPYHIDRVIGTKFLGLSNLLLLHPCRQFLF